MKWASCIAGQATTNWKAHREGDPRTPLVIKYSWQHPEREEEGELLREATDTNPYAGKRGMLQGDISINNLMMNEDEDDPSWRSFLTDLDLAIISVYRSGFGFFYLSLFGKTYLRNLLTHGISGW